MSVLRRLKRVNSNYEKHIPPELKHDLVKLRETHTQMFELTTKSIESNFLSNQENDWYDGDGFSENFITYIRGYIDGILSGLSTAKVDALCRKKWINNDDWILDIQFDKTNREVNDG